MGRGDTVEGSTAQTSNLTPVLDRNIQAILERRQRELAQSPLQERIADVITSFTGSMSFVYIHLLIFGFWILANIGWIRIIKPWDPSLVILAMAASVEAIFLSTFVLISQNRMAAAADKRADLNLQISLLSEHEITKLVELTSAIAERLNVRTNIDGELPELKQDVRPEKVLDELDMRKPS
ncbi:DUF1003 domain-containing protein [Rhodoligotrophos ferricapiens]|uniref:DUF1003 domain-containing protein n=1 Tax=Rhodoligotrophos ferricapiens TaxID=3069264 RepID=UPI00315CC56D